MNSGPIKPIRRAATLLGLLVSAWPSLAVAQDMRFRDGRFLEVVGAVTLQRADEASSDEAVMNMPFLPGDRVWTDESSRAEIVFAEGEILWIAERSKVDSLGRGGQEQDERLGLRVFAGSFGARVRSGGPGFEFRVPGGSITTTGASAFRVDVRGGETVVSVSEGEVLADLAGQRMSLRSGERVRYAGNRVDGPFMYARENLDGFDRWCEDRFALLSEMASGNGDERLPEELGAYAGELDRNGEWVYEQAQGYVYVPRVAYNWAPYTDGRWTFTLYGWTWVDNASWGFVTSHYGRWGYSAGIGWHWRPRVGFSGAWVGWSAPGGAWANTVGWCALGYNDRPVGSFSYGSGGHAVARGGSSGNAVGRGWSFADRQDLGRADLQRRRVDVPVEEAQRAVAWNQATGPDREFRGNRDAVSASGGHSRSKSGEGRVAGGDSGPRIQLRPTPGDSLPELRSDPTTTIPSPESRRGRTIGQDGFKDEQDRKYRDDGSRVYGEVSVMPGQGARPRPVYRAAQEPQPSPGNGAAGSGAASGDSSKADATRGKATRDPLLSRFFRSITRPEADRDAARDANTNQKGDGSARPRESPPRDTTGARESTPRERPRPAEAKPAEGSREKSRPQGTDRPQAQPRNTPRPQPSPHGGRSSDDRGARKPSPQDR